MIVIKLGKLKKKLELQKVIDTYYNDCAFSDLF